MRCARVRNDFDVSWNRTSLECSFNEEHILAITQAICIHRRRSPRHHVSRLYERIARRKGHPTAIGAVARHLAEATFWILSKHEPYREPRSTVVSSTRDKREVRLSS